MRTNFASAVVGLTLLCLVPRSVVAQGTAFTYQGLLNDTNGPANGSYDLQFLVFDAGEGGIQQGLTLNRFGMAVSNGLFTTTLDYGANIFTGPSRWLEIRVAPFETSAFTTLAPRQPLTPTPYAMYAPNAGTAASATSVPWLALTGVPAGLADGVDDNTLYSAGSGLSLAGTIFSLNTAFTDARYDGRYWKLTGNSGTTAGVNFLGTTDYEPLELKVNGARALRLEPGGGIPNLVGGIAGNYVEASISGATIAGGGSFNSSNRVTWHFGAVGGGLGNLVGAYAGVVGGGENNAVDTSALHAGILGGWGNAVRPNADRSVIGGGRSNEIQQLSYASVLGGGQGNLIRSNSHTSIIVGGFANVIGTDAIYSVVGGGTRNTNAAGHAIVAGGYGNSVEADAVASTISGGTNNLIEINARSATIGGGEDNVIYADARLSTIGGGSGNEIEANGIYNTIGGGRFNSIQPGGGNGGSGCTIGGGFLNRVGTEVNFGTIGGGQSNFVGTNAQASTVAGGQANRVDGWNSAIGGGYDNTIAASYSTIAGGRQNTLMTSYSAVGGGYSNVVESLASYGTISGGNLNLVRSNASYATIGGGDDNVIQFDADDATISGGASQIIGTNADYSTIGGGNLNTIGDNASRATIAGGAGHLISTNANYGTIPGGRYAQANHYGQLAYASGRFADTGDAQTSVYVVRRTTTDATQSELFLDGASLRLTVANGATWTFEALVVGRSSTGNSAGYRLTGVVENVGGGVGGTFQAPQILREDVTAWDADATTDNVNDALILRVTGAAGTTIRWVASVRTVEVRY